jgi:hypothetical protein
MKTKKNKENERAIYQFANYKTNRVFEKKVYKLNTLSASVSFQKKL